MKRTVNSGGVLTYDPDRGVTISLVGGFAECRQVECSGANQQIHGRRPLSRSETGVEPILPCMTGKRATAERGVRCFYIHHL
jgi:hypothetical protein